MSKYTRKPQLPPQDEFVSFWHRFAERAEPYAIHVAITLAVALVVWVVGYLALGHYETRAENGGLELGKIAIAYNEEVSDTSAKEPDKEAPHYKNQEERIKVTLQKLDEFDKKFSSARLSDDAQLLRAAVLYDAGRLEEAASVYEKLSKRELAPSLLALAKEGVGLCAESRDKLDDALKAYQALEPKQGTILLDQALFDQARVYLKKGDRKKAAELYRDLIKRVPHSPLKDEVQNRLAELGT